MTDQPTLRELSMKASRSRTRFTAQTASIQSTTNAFMATLCTKVVNAALTKFWPKHSQPLRGVVMGQNKGVCLSAPRFRASHRIYVSALTGFNRMTQEN
jgi:hypothetical protein